MEILEQKNNRMVFSASANESIINAVRRYINEIPTLAIDEVELIKNDSALYDETLAHRMGLIPIKTDKVSEKVTGQLKLNVKKEGFVHSGDLQGNVDVVYDMIPITNLNKAKRERTSSSNDSKIFLNESSFCNIAKSSASLTKSR